MKRAGLLAWLCLVVSCGPKSRPDDSGDDDDTGPDGPTSCSNACSEDTHSILDCEGNVVSECTGNLACDSGLLTCVDACTASESNARSIGCNYYATSMDVMTGGYCFAAFVANTWTSPAHINVNYQGAALGASFIRIPVGSGPSLTYAAYDPVAGLAPNEVAILFLTGGTGGSPLCPVASAVPSATISGTGVGNSFEIQTDVPVVAYQINPYGGGSAAVTAGSLLLPTSAWGTDYIAVNVGGQGVAGASPSLNIIAKEDNTVATIVPTVPITGGVGVPAGSAGQPFNITLQKGQHVQITQPGELTGSTVTADKPIGFMAGQPCMNMPTGTAFCDHGEQMVPPVNALANKYTGVMYRPRVPAESKTFWKIIGAVDGTTLTWSTSVGGPLALSRGQSVQFETGTPFTVTSQDAEHPFMLFTYMSGSQHVADGFGDPDFVYNVPPAQYLKQYVFFTDPTYPETNLVVTRSRGIDGLFHDVTLDCLGPLAGWAPVDSDLEFVRVDLITGNFQNVGACSTGRREVRSDAPFGLQVWGWGTPNTSNFTANVSYGYPGGMNVKPINSVIL